MGDGRLAIVLETVRRWHPRTGGGLCGGKQWRQEQGTGRGLPWSEAEKSGTLQRPRMSQVGRRRMEWGKCRSSQLDIFIGRIWALSHFCVGKHLGHSTAVMSKFIILKTLAT